MPEEKKKDTIDTFEKSLESSAQKHARIAHEVEKVAYEASKQGEVGDNKYDASKVDAEKFAKDAQSAFIKARSNYLDGTLTKDDHAEVDDAIFSEESFAKAIGGSLQRGFSVESIIANVGKASQGAAQDSAGKLTRMYVNDDGFKPALEARVGTALKDDIDQQQMIGLYQAFKQQEAVSGPYADMLKDLAAKKK